MAKVTINQRDIKKIVAIDDGGLATEYERIEPNRFRLSYNYYGNESGGDVVCDACGEWRSVDEPCRYCDGMCLEEQIESVISQIYELLVDMVELVIYVGKPNEEDDIYVFTMNTEEEAEGTVTKFLGIDKPHTIVSQYNMYD